MNYDTLLHDDGDEVTIWLNICDNINIKTDQNSDRNMITLANS